MLPVRDSISEISKVIYTGGSMPVVIMANDFEDYICKYGQSSKLINEYLSYHFLQIWDLPVLPAAFVNIRSQHLPGKFINNRIQPQHFSKPTFGLQYKNSALDVNNVLLGLRNDYNELAKFINKADILKIGLFDLWLANTDRNHNNFNLLINPTKEGYQLMAIDHTDIFDGGRLGDALAQLTEHDSIIYSDLGSIFTVNKKKTDEYVNNLLLKFPIFVSECESRLHQIVQGLPDEWCEEKDFLEISIRESVIQNPAWINDTVSNFRELIHSHIRYTHI